MDSDDLEVVPYHWHSRQRLVADQSYLRRFQENLLSELKAELERVHGVERSLRYWRLLLGPWLNVAIPVIFDRWTSIEEFSTDASSISTIVVSEETRGIPANDLTDFNALVQDPLWNHRLYAELLQGRPEIFRCQHYEGSSVPMKTERKSRQGRDRISVRIWKKLEIMATRVTSNDAVVMMATYLSKKEEMKLCMLFRQFPMTRSTKPSPKVDWDPGWRGWKLGGTSNSLFENWARSWIPMNIPRLYLEGFGDLVDAARDQQWPESPDLIWTSSAFYSDEIFKVWTAECVENGTALIIGQHGGVYGLAQWSSTEAHEVAVCDRYLSWGWDDEREKRVLPVAILRPQSWLKLQDRNPHELLLVMGAGPRQAHRMYSGPVAGQWEDYYEDQCVFIKALSGEGMADLVVRPDPSYSGGNGKSVIADCFPNVVFDDCHRSFREALMNTKLMVVSYNGSAMLEGTSMDVPTVIWLNPSLWEMRPSAAGVLEQLRHVGMLHDDPNSAAAHVSDIWHDPDAWWESMSVRSARRALAEKYARMPIKPLKELRKAFSEVLAVR